MMNPRSLKKILILIPTFALAILLMQQKYSSIFGIIIGVTIALSSCEMIQKAVNNSFARKANRAAQFFLIGFFFRYIFLAALLYLAIIYFKVNVIALALSFTVVQLLYPFYLVRSLEKHR